MIPSLRATEYRLHATWVEKQGQIVHKQRQEKQESEGKENNRESTRKREQF